MVDLATRTPQELKNLLANNHKHGQNEMVVAVLREMERRGMATRKEYRLLEWNQENVEKVMKPFKTIASNVTDNQRTAYTEAGGKRIGRAKTDPERQWIDTYSAIKTPKVNAVFVCYVKLPGDQAKFEMHIEQEVTKVYSADQLPQALLDWQATADRAAV